MDPKKAVLISRARPNSQRRIAARDIWPAGRAVAQVLAEYDAVREADPEHVPITASQLPSNSRRNRYFNVVPYDFNRVVLQAVSRARYLSLEYFISQQLLWGKTGSRLNL